MYGKGILKGLGVTLKRYWNTYWDDIVWLFQGKKRYNSPEGIAHRSSSKTRGIFTVQYPEEKLLLPEEARYVPFLVYDEGAEGKKEVRCTSCGICAKVCPPQCIWIGSLSQRELTKLAISQRSSTLVLSANEGIGVPLTPVEKVRKILLTLYGS